MIGKRDGRHVHVSVHVQSPQRPRDDQQTNTGAVHMLHVQHNRGYMLHHERRGLDVPLSSNHRVRRAPRELGHEWRVCDQLCDAIVATAATL